MCFLRFLFLYMITLVPFAASPYFFLFYRQCVISIVFRKSKIESEEKIANLVSICRNGSNAGQFEIEFRNAVALFSCPGHDESSQATINMAPNFIFQCEVGNFFDGIDRSVRETRARANELFFCLFVCLFVFISGLLAFSISI